jgi:hypothetical protein
MTIMQALELGALELNLRYYGPSIMASQDWGQDVVVNHQVYNRKDSASRVVVVAAAHKN